MLRGFPWLGSFSTVQCIRHIERSPSCLSGTWRGTLGGVLLCSSVHQAFDGPASLLYSCQSWHRGWERLWWWLHPLHMTQHYRLASMADWLSSTGISHHNLLPHISLICLSTVNSSPCPGIAPQSPNSRSQPLRLPGYQRSCPGHVWLWQGLILIPFTAIDQLFHSQL